LAVWLKKGRRMRMRKGIKGGKVGRDPWKASTKEGQSRGARLGGINDATNAAKFPNQQANGLVPQPRSRVWVGRKLKGGGGSREQNVGEGIIQAFKRSVIMNMKACKVKVREHRINSSCKGGQRGARIAGRVAVTWWTGRGSALTKRNITEARVREQKSGRDGPVIGSWNEGWSNFNRRGRKARARVCNAIQDGTGSTVRESIMSMRRAIMSGKPEIKAVSLREEVKVRETVRTEASSRGRSLGSIEGEIAVTDKTPGMRGSVTTKGGDHLPKLTGSGLRATRIPWSIEGKHT
jgi:hypothetical protein